MINKKVALTAAKQAGAAKAFAVWKSRRQFKREKTEKSPYVPGTIGLSEVSAAIRKEYAGQVASRKSRKKIDKILGRKLRFTGDSR